MEKAGICQPLLRCALCLGDSSGFEVGRHGEEPLIRPQKRDPEHSAPNPLLLTRSQSRLLRVCFEASFVTASLNLVDPGTLSRHPIIVEPCLTVCDSTGIFDDVGRRLFRAEEVSNCAASHSRGVGLPVPAPPSNGGLFHPGGGQSVTPGSEYKRKVNRLPHVYPSWWDVAREIYSFWLET